MGVYRDIPDDKNTGSAMNLLITQYPFTQSQLTRLSALVNGPLETIVLSSISARGYLGIYLHFRRMQADSVYIPALDPAVWPFIPPLQVLAMLIRCRRRFVIDLDLKIVPFGVVAVVSGFVSVSLGIAHGVYTLARDWLRLRRLKKLKRARITGEGGKTVAYLKTNLWLGIQAGGSVAHASGVINGLLKKGYEVDVASVETPVAIADCANLRFHAIRSRGVFVIPRELNHYRNNDSFIAQSASILEGPPAFFYQRLSLGSYAGVVLSRQYNRPLVIEYNGSESWLARNWGSPLLMEKMALLAEDVCLRHAHVVVTVSEVLKDELIRRGIEPERIVVHANGVDAEAFNPENFTEADRNKLRKRYGIPKDALVVTFVGTFGPWHGAEVFSQCIANLEKDDPVFLENRKLHFIFIGDGTRLADVKDTVSRLDEPARVTLTGLIDQEETPLHLAASDILVSPHVPNPDGSAFFGSPTKLFEYLAAGRPVIGSDLNQIAEILDGCPHAGELKAASENKNHHGAHGIRMTPNFSSELAASIRFLVENPEWRKQAGRNARTKALERYTWDFHVSAILEGVEGAKARESAPAPIRLLFNGLHSKSGGGLTYLKNILPLLARDPGVDVHLCVHEDQQGSVPNDIGDATVHILNFRPGFWNLLLREQFDVPRLARDIGADVTFSPANYGPILAPNPVIMLRNALSVAFVERRPMKLIYWALVYVGTMLSMVTAKRVITVSEFAKTSAGKALIGMLGDRMTVVPHGVSPVFSPVAKAKTRPFLLAVSDIYVQKNLANLILAFAKIVRTRRDLKLLIAGKPVDREYFLHLKQIISREGLDAFVEFLGNLAPKRLAELYRTCEIFVFPSTVETFGNPLVEAMASGAAIASSNTAAMPEVIGDAALFFDPHDTGDMAAVIERLLKDAKLRREIGSKGVARAKAFSWEKTAEKTIAILRDAAETA